MPGLDLSAAIAELETLRAEVVARLRTAASPELVGRKRTLDDAIGCLALCQTYQIGPRSQVTVLPEPLTRSPSSELRVIEDHESDDRHHWQEVVVQGERLRPSPGDLILHRR